MRKRGTAIIHQDERIYFCVLSGLALLSLSLYMYFISVSVIHVVVRKEINLEIATVASRVSSLEAEYIEGQHLINKEVASMNGYTLAQHKIFIDRTVSPVALLGN